MAHTVHASNADVLLVSRLHGVVIKRADALRLFDLIIELPWFHPDGKMFKDATVIKVTKLETYGDDIVINDMITTSFGNRYIVCKRDSTNQVAQADPELERLLDEWDEQ